MSQKTKSEKSNLAGYRLHLERLRFSGKSSIRTMKFPLLPYGVEGKRGKKEKKKKYQERIQQEAQENTFFQDFMQSVRSDYENMYGPLNLPSYIQDKNRYSLKDFWIDSLRAGVTMHHSAAKRNDVLKQVERLIEKIDNQQQDKMKSKNLDFFDVIDFEKFKKQFILTSQKRSTANVESQIKGCILQKEQDTDSANYFIQKIATDYQELMTNNGDQEEYLRENYGVDKSLYEIGCDIKEMQTASFYIYPSFDLVKDLSIEECIKRVDRFISENALGRNVEELIGISDSVGGFSFYFNNGLKLLQNNQIDKMKSAILQASSLWDGKEDDLQYRLEFLSERAQQVLPVNLVGNWHEYRADIGGSIQSWVSNSLRQDIQIRNLLYGYQEEKVKRGGEKEMQNTGGHFHELENILGDGELGGYQDYFTEKDDQAGLRQTEEVIKKAEQLSNHLIHEKEEIDIDQPKIKPNILDDYRDVLADFRNKFNQLYQRRYGLEEQDESVDQKDEKGKKVQAIRKKYPKIFKELPKIPKFLGDVKTEETGAYDKYLHSYNGLRKGVLFLQNIQIDYSQKIDNSDRTEANSIERVQRALQNILRLYQSTDAQQIKNQYIRKVLEKYCENSSLFDGESNYIYRNEKYARDTRGQKIELRYRDEELMQDKFIRELIGEMDKFQWRLDIIDQHKWYERVAEWGVLIEIQKIKIGLATWFYEISVPYDFQEIEKDKIHFRKVEAIVKRYNQDQLDNAEKNTIIQQGILSEMRGMIAQMSKREIIARYVVQPMSADSKYPLVLDNGRYYIYPQSIIKDKDKAGLEPTTFVSKEKSLIKDKTKTLLVKQEKLFAIHSSKYQTQFLNNGLNEQLKRWRSMEPTLSEWSFIVEDTYKIEWKEEGDSYIPNLKKENNSRLFVAIPFKIGVEDKQKTVAIKQQNKFIGIDIGEYGVAYYGLDGGNFSANPFVSGFFFQPDMRKIREGIQENKARQKAGTFTGHNTYTKRIRDNATTKIRNKIHRLVVENNALPIYEKEVSAFESGSGKISAIYNSIKRSDVYAELSADELEHKLIWGNDKIMIGAEIGAYATSYMCSKCYDSIYAYIAREDYDKLYKVVEVKEQKQVQDKWNATVKFNVDGEKVCAYIERRDKKIEERNTFKGKDTINFIRKYQRPPFALVKNAEKLPLEIHQQLNEYIEKMRVKSNGEKEGISVWENERGSQGVFRCAFCNECSDADIQASMWIALKGYLQNVKNAYQKKESKEQKKLYESSIGMKAMQEIADEFSKGGKDQVRFILDFAKKNRIKM